MTVMNIMVMVMMMKKTSLATAKKPKMEMRRVRMPPTVKTNGTIRKSRVITWMPKMNPEQLGTKKPDNVGIIPSLSRFF